MDCCNSSKMVEYVEPLMSKELLCKFPDNSAFDLDYSQSSIWSPLVPRPYSSTMNYDLDLDFITPTKFTFKMAFKSSNLNKVGSNSKKKVNNSAFKFNLSCIKWKKSKNNRKIAPSDFSPTSIQPTRRIAAKKMWNKVLKAGCKHFKRKKKDPTVHVRLSNYFRHENM